MSSTTQTQNQSAESNVANALDLSIGHIDISQPKQNKVGGKSSNILYTPTKKGLYLNMQVPLLTWGANVFKDPQSGKETYDMALQFPRSDYGTPETDKLLQKFQEIEQHIKSEAITNSMAWFNKKTMTPEVIEALWTPMLKYSKDPQTGEPDMSKAPTLKLKLPCWDGKFNCEVYDTTHKMLYPSEDDSSITPLDLIPKGVNVVVIIQCGGLWFANGKFGCTWRLFQAVVQPKPSMRGRCLINMSSSEALTSKNAITSSSSQNEVVGTTVEDDSDEEVEESEPTPVPAPTPAPTPASTPAPKKKIVRKKEPSA